MSIICDIVVSRFDFQTTKMISVSSNSLNTCTKVNYWVPTIMASVKLDWYTGCKWRGTLLYPRCATILVVILDLHGRQFNKTCLKLLLMAQLLYEFGKLSHTCTLYRLYKLPFSAYLNSILLPIQITNKKCIRKTQAKLQGWLAEHAQCICQTGSRWNWHTKPKENH